MTIRERRFGINPNNAAMDIGGFFIVSGE